MILKRPERISGALFYAFVYCSNLILIGRDFGNLLLQKRFLTKFWNPQWLLDVQNANLEQFLMPIAPILP